MPPEGSPFARIFRVLKAAFVNRKLAAPASAAELYEPAPGVDGQPHYQMAYTPRMKALDRAAINTGRPHMVSLTLVEETKAFFGIMPIFLCVCIFQMCYDPIFTLLPYPGDVMDRKMGKGEIPASSISFANTFGVLFTVAFYDLALVPLTVKCGRPISMVKRIGIGFVLEALALLSAGLIETARYKLVQNVGLIDAWNANTAPDKEYTDVAYTEPMSIWWQFLPYFLLGSAEAFTNIGVMELFYTQVSDGMRALGTAVYLLSVAIGTYMATALNIIIAAASGSDPWVADNPMFGHYDYYFYVNIAILLVFGLLPYVFISRKYTEKPVLDTGIADPFDQTTKAHAELGNVSRTWPSVRRASRVSELRQRSSMSQQGARAASMRSTHSGQGGGNAVHQLHDNNNVL